MEEQQPHRQKGNLTAAEAMLRAERRRHRNETDQMKNKIVNLELQLSELSVNFDKANKKLIAISPASQFSDKIIVDTYEELCQSVKDWIDANCGHLDNMAEKIESNARSDSDREELNKLLDDGATVKLIQSHPRCGDFFLTKIVLRFLFEFILRQARWIPGLSEEQEKLLQLAMNNLQSAFPDRGPEFREIWRSDTYKSLSVSAKLQELKNTTLEYLAAKLSSTIAHFTDDKKGSDVTGLKAIIRAAAELADAIRRSPVQYSFIYNFAPQMATESRTINIQTLEKNNLVDVETGISIKSLTNNRQTGEALCTITPTLAKLVPDGTVTRLVKGTVLVRMKTDGEKENTESNKYIAGGEESGKAPEEQIVEVQTPIIDDRKSSKTKKQAVQPDTLHVNNGNTNESNTTESKDQTTRSPALPQQRSRQTWASIVKT